jgi:UDP-GlcNAc:undecaprenyl-phosphate GlcNAc-1-phosphate transferase
MTLDAWPVFLIGTLLPSFLIAWLGGWLVRAIVPHIGLVDTPSGHKTHTQPTPLGGGLAVWAAVVIPLALGQLAVGALLFWPSLIDTLALPDSLSKHVSGYWSQSGLLWTIVAAGSVLMVLGLVDDFRPIDWRARLFVQIAAASFVVWQGVQVTVFVEIVWLTRIATVLWIVGIINAVNMLDNMDALSSGTALIAATLLGMAMLIVPDAVGTPQWFVAGFLFLLVGGLAGFLVHNAPPARLFLGDAGSYFVGYWLAVGTILGTFSSVDGTLPRFTILLPLCVLAVPLYDMTTVIAIRLRNGKSPFAADRNHFSHRLVALGMTRTRAVATIHLVTLATGLGGLLLLDVKSTWGAILVVTSVAALLAIVYVLETAADRSA